MATPSSTAVTTQIYKIEDLVNEMARRDNLRAAIKVIDDNYLWQLTHLNGFLIKTRDNTLSQEEKEYYKLHASDSIKTVSEEIAKIEQMIHQLQVSQTQYITMMKEFGQSMI